jgi:hypothetical protein
MSFIQFDDVKSGRVKQFLHKCLTGSLSNLVSDFVADYNYIISV